MKDGKRRRKERIKLDQVMRVMFGLSKKVMVPMLNQLFQEKFVVDEVELHYENGKFIDHVFGQLEGDAFITVRTKHGKNYSYHIEFQTRNDGQMVIRMFRYSFEKAVEKARAEERMHRREAGAESQTVIELPRQLVIFLEENRRIGDELSFLLRLPDGRELEYGVPVLKYWTYSAARLKEERLYALLPLQVFKLRKRMSQIVSGNRSDAEKSRLLGEQFEELKDTIRHTLHALKEVDEENHIGTGDMDRILRVLHHITDYLYNQYGPYEQVREEVAEMIKTWIDPKVKEEAIKEGIEKGIEKGRVLQSKEVAGNLLALGADIQLIVKATGLSEAELEQLRNH